MKDIAHRLNAYIENHILDLGDSSCETVSCTKLMQNLTRVILRRSATALRNWKNFCASCPWKIITQFSIFVAVCAVPTNAKPFVTACNMARI